ncbi:GGDEF domain-containing protein [Acidiphilium acidophilum]|uniref:diguanylate cyclase n=1 Tax=Acidiphilium acidophilum TaxID=76588 RepID=A0AAW9DM11_ACIAO|nr:GGDEF domain-containing protein [Acidiphilium acidophilum]MDX5929745.1 GGDEF domain-containing protein [Acidiphilium acidophilum]
MDTDAQTILSDIRNISARAIAFLAEHDILPSPDNYSVAFSYIEGRSLDLVQSMRQLLKNGKRLTDLDLCSIDCNRPSMPQQVCHTSVNQELQAVVETLLNNINEAGEGMSRFGEALQTNLGSLQDVPPPVALHIIAASMLASTRTIMAQNAVLQSRLQTTLAETVSLRDQLDQRRQDALLDPLTGLFNRRALNDHTAETLSESSNQSVCIIIVDIDHFKKINDNYGHLVGDVYIQNVAAIIKSNIRVEQTAYRFGGEEFVVLAPGATRDIAIKTGEKIRKALSKMRLRRNSENTDLLPISASIGIAELIPGESGAQLFARADHALYNAKHRGRNCTVVDLPRVAGGTPNFSDITSRP